MVKILFSGRFTAIELPHNKEWGAWDYLYAAQIIPPNLLTVKNYVILAYDPGADALGGEDIKGKKIVDDTVISITPRGMKV